MDLLSQKMAMGGGSWRDCFPHRHSPLACGSSRRGNAGFVGNMRVMQPCRRIASAFTDMVAGSASDSGICSRKFAKGLRSSCRKLHLTSDRFMQSHWNSYCWNFEGYFGMKSSWGRNTPSIKRIAENEEAYAACSPSHDSESDSPDTLKVKLKEDNLLKLVPRILHLVTFGIGFLLTVWSGRASAAIGGNFFAAAASTSAKTRGLEVLTSAWTGLVAGCLHTLTGPDHLAALAPLCIGRSKVESAAVGALWGVGHDAGQVLFGIAFLILKDKLHIDLIRTWGARVVGMTLIAIGAVGIKEARELPVSCLTANEHGGQSAGLLEGGVPVAKKSLRLTFATGLVYGLQPDALLMILPALALPSRLAGLAFLGMFLVGTVIAMGSYTAFIGSCSEALQERIPWITRRLTLASSLVAIAFGLGVFIGEWFGMNLF